MSRKIVALVVVVILITGACTNVDSPKPLARVYDKYLFPSDIDASIFNDVDKGDSAIIMRSYVDKWVQSQLLLKLAEDNLNDKQKNVSRELENYRASLLIFKFEQAYVSQKMDTLFTHDDLLKYYETNRNYFILKEPIVKALYIKLRKEAPQIKKIRMLYKSSNEEDIKSLDNLAYQAAVKYDYFGDRWVALDLIVQQLPSGGGDNIESKIAPNTPLELEDDEHVYLVFFKDIMKRGEVMPFEYSTQQIREIIFNTRRNGMIRDLERNLMSRGLNNGDAQVFVN